MQKMSRHQHRIWALQLLYGLDINDELNIVNTRRRIAEFKKDNLLEEEGYYFEDIVYGVIDNMVEYDKKIDQQAIDWDLKRMAFIDKNILRIAIHEMNNGIPLGVAINEAVELAKEFADEKSSVFINGILAKI